MNPVEEYLQIKEAAGGAASKAWDVAKYPLSALGMTAGVAAGYHGIVAGVRAAHRAITKKRDFDQMMSANPDLREARRENPRQFDQQWSSLRGMNPEFSADPIVAGTYMRKMHMSPMTAGDAIVESLKGRQGLGPSPFDAKPFEPVKATGISAKDMSEHWPEQEG